MLRWVYDSEVQGSAFRVQGYNCGSAPLDFGPELTLDPAVDGPYYKTTSTAKKGGQNGSKSFYQA